MEYLLNLNSIETHAFINGEYVESKSGKKIVKISSYSGRKLVEIDACDEKDVEYAVKCAYKAYKDGVWTRKTPEERKKVMLRLAQLMRDNLNELACLDTYETGRAYKNYYMDSIPKAIEAIEYFAEAIDKIYEKSIIPRKDEFSVIVREPIGVVGIITPWNDPMVVGSWKFAPALLMGNSVIVKPAEQSSLSMIYTAKLAKEAGIPDGVFNVVPGYGEVTGKALALNKDVSGIFFTGSSEIGKQIIKYSGESNMKKVGLECGGKSPYIVTCNCKNLKKSANVLARNVFYNQGQICSAPSRLIIHKDIKEEFLKYLVDEAKQYIPGNPENSSNEVGCVVSKEQFDKIAEYINIGKNEAMGYYEVSGQSDLPNGACGVNPIIFYGVKPNARIAQEEIFGPVLTVIEFESIEEALDIANGTKYGLAGAVWTDDINEAYYVSNKIKSGIVHINSYGDDNNMVPFGGMKESGIGKDKSIYTFDEYSEIKTVWMHFDY